MVYSRRAMSAAAAVVTCGVLLAGCGSEGEDERTSTSDTTSQPAYDDAYALGEVKKIDQRFRQLNPNNLIGKDVPWVTDPYRRTYNEQIQEWKGLGVVQKGKASTTSLHLAESKPDAPGGWDLSVYVCTESTLRAYIDGEDVSVDPLDPGKPLPKGTRKGVTLDGYTTPDRGRTWQLNSSQVLEEEAAREAPCAKS